MDGNSSAAAFGVVHCGSGFLGSSPGLGATNILANSLKSEAAVSLVHAAAMSGQTSGLSGGPALRSAIPP
jgi:hypothetical protein